MCNTSWRNALESFVSLLGIILIREYFMAVVTMERIKHWLLNIIFFTVGIILLGVKGLYRLITGKELKMFYD
jgi:hypothetical protein